MIAYSWLVILDILKSGSIVDGVSVYMCVCVCVYVCVCVSVCVV